MTSIDSSLPIKIVVKGQPIPAKRVTARTLWKAKAYADYKEDLAWQFKKALKPIKAITEDITIKGLRFYRSGNRRADIDNLLKGVMESLALCGYIANDKQVVRIKDMEMFHGQEQPRIEIEL
jgi:Holliday junction resolvase RusA-like endonuclease